MSAEQTPKMTVTLPSDLEIVLTRSFNAPRELVFRAMSERDLAFRWWGHRSSETVIDKFEFEVGGAWRIVIKDDGAEYAYRGKYLAIEPPSLITYTFEFEMMPGNVLVETIILDEIDGWTTLTSTSKFDTVEDRDGMLETGMADGAAEGYDQLEELLAGMSSGAS